MNQLATPAAGDNRSLRLLNLRPEEFHRTTLLFVQLFAASGIFVLGRTVRDTLFLSRYPIDVLPWMFVLYGIAASLTALIYGRYADRVSRSTLLHTTAAAGIISYAAVWVLIAAGISWVYPFFYVWAEVVANLFLLEFWTLASDFDPPREARRLNATIGAARPLGIIFFGAASGSVVQWIGTGQLLFVLILLMALYAGCVHQLRHVPRYSPAVPLRDFAPRPGGPPHPRERGYFGVLSGLILVMFVTLTLGDYQFKVIASNAYTEDALAQFFGFFYAVVGFLSVLFQLFATPRILSRLGVGPALAVMPGVFGTASLFLLGWPCLPAAAVMKFSDNGLQFTLHDTAMQSLYAPFSSGRRARVRGFLEGAVKPLSYGAGGLALVFLVAHGLSVRDLCLVTVSFAFLWLCLIPLIRRRYLQLLEMGLAGPMASQLFDEPFVLGSAERRILIEKLRSPDPNIAMLALEQMRGDDSDEFRRALVSLAGHPEPRLRTRAVQMLDPLCAGGQSRLFSDALQDPEPAVRSAAVSALARISGNEQPEPILRRMADESEEVSGAALAGLLLHGGVEGSTRAGIRMLELRDSIDLMDRRQACAVLAQLGRRSYLSLLKLMRDESPRVRRAAVRAAAATGDGRLVPLIVRALRDPSTRKTALAALAAVGEPAVAAIGEALRDYSLPRAVRLELPRILGGIIAGSAQKVLEEHLENPDSHLRLRTFSSLSRLRHKLGRAPIPPRQLAPRIQRESIEAFGNIQGWAAARDRFQTELLDEEMLFRARRAERRILRLLGMTCDLLQIDRIVEALDEPSSRAQALETLDALLPATLRNLVFPLLEYRSAPETGLPVPNPSLCLLPPVEYMLLQAHHPNPYVVLLALDSLARAGEKTAVPAAEKALEHADPLVREAGLRALLALAPERARVRAHALLHDADSNVVCWAEYAAAGRERPPQRRVASLEEIAMYGTVEKILWLKAAPLFAGLSGEDLAPLARVAEVITLAPGQMVFTEGSPSDHLYVVIRGLVALESHGRELRRIAPIHTLGELEVLDRGPEDTSARVLEEALLLRIGEEEFFEVLHEQPEIAEALIRILAGQVREAHQRLLSLPAPASRVE